MSKNGTITLVENQFKNSMDVDVFESRREMIVKLCKSGATFDNCGYGTCEHLEGLDDLIEDLKKVKSNIKSEMVHEYDHGKPDK